MMSRIEADTTFFFFRKCQLNIPKIIASEAGTLPETEEYKEKKLLMMSREKKEKAADMSLRKTYHRMKKNEGVISTSVNLTAFMPFIPEEIKKSRIK